MFATVSSAIFFWSLVLSVTDLKQILLNAVTYSNVLFSDICGQVFVSLWSLHSSCRPGPLLYFSLPSPHGLLAFVGHMVNRSLRQSSPSLSSSRAGCVWRSDHWLYWDNVHRPYMDECGKSQFPGSLFLWRWSLVQRIVIERDYWFCQQKTRLIWTNKCVQKVIGSNSGFDQRDHFLGDDPWSTTRRLKEMIDSVSKSLLNAA